MALDCHPVLDTVLVKGLDQIRVPQRNGDKMPRFAGFFVCQLQRADDHFFLDKTLINLIGLQVLLKLAVRNFFVFNLYRGLEKIQQQQHQDEIPDRKGPRLLPDLLFRWTVDVHVRLFGTYVKFIDICHPPSLCLLLMAGSKIYFGSAASIARSDF